MNNVQVVDDAVNCTFDLFAIDDEGFVAIFHEGTDVEFEDDLFLRLGDERARELLTWLWGGRQDKKRAVGIHGTLFFGALCDEKRPFYPTKRESEMIAHP